MRTALATKKVQMLKFALNPAFRQADVPVAQLLIIKKNVYLVICKDANISHHNYSIKPV